MVIPQGQDSWRCFLVMFDRGDRDHSVRSLSASAFHRMRHTQANQLLSLDYMPATRRPLFLSSFSPFLSFYFLLLEIFILTFLLSCPSQQFPDHSDSGESWDKILYPERASVLPCWLASYMSFRISYVVYYYDLFFHFSVTQSQWSYGSYLISSICIKSVCDDPYLVIILLVSISRNVKYLST